jgi:beta-ketodecanoyl-[acyl-carrier-protein] synthase
LSEILITGTGLYTPPDSVTNAELVESLTRANLRWNEEHKAEIERGDVEERDMPSEKFIERASGIGHRYVLEKTGLLDPERLRPHLPTRSEDEISIQAEICLEAAQEALAQAGRKGADVDAVIVGASNLQRAYPAVAIEVQEALGAGGFAYDMNAPGVRDACWFSTQRSLRDTRTGNSENFTSSSGTHVPPCFSKPTSTPGQENLGRLWGHDWLRSSRITFETMQAFLIG